MADKLRNIGASVRARLLDRARAGRLDFQILLTRFALERLLYRLSISAHKDRFILKGAMLFVTWVTDPFRPTRDLDLLGQGDSNVNAIVDTFRGICETQVADDGVIFDVTGLRAVPIRAEMEYGGVRVTTTATIDGARIPIQVDVGFGDAVTPEPVEIDYPTLLGNPAPHLRAYPVETVVSEKFHALVTLGIANTRLKDFNDLWLIAQTFELRLSTLREAVKRTFNRRSTALQLETPVGLTDEFAIARASQWRAFLTRERMASAPEIFSEVVADLHVFLMPLIGNSETESLWPPGGPWTMDHN